MSTTHCNENFDALTQRVATLLERDRFQNPTFELNEASITKRTIDGVWKLATHSHSGEFAMAAVRNANGRLVDVLIGGVSLVEGDLPLRCWTDERVARASYVRLYNAFHESRRRHGRRHSTPVETNAPDAPNTPGTPHRLVA